MIVPEADAEEAKKSPPGCAAGSPTGGPAPTDPSGLRRHRVRDVPRRRREPEELLSYADMDFRRQAGPAGGLSEVGTPAFGRSTDSKS